jgi:hypothetical protein
VKRDNNLLKKPSKHLACSSYYELWEFSQGCYFSENSKLNYKSNERAMHKKSLKLQEETTRYFLKSGHAFFSLPYSTLSCRCVLLEWNKKISKNSKTMEDALALSILRQS